MHYRRHKQPDRTKEQEEMEKETDKKRAFVNYMKPPFCWNFFLKDDEETGEEVKIPHVLRAEAEPQKCYIDGRVENVLEDINSIGFHLTRHEEIRWATLRNFTLQIFKDLGKNEGSFKEEEKKNNWKHRTDGYIWSDKYIWSNSLLNNIQTH